MCIVADRGMISAGTIAALQSAKLGVRFILGARLRRVTEVNKNVLARAGRYHVVHGTAQCSQDPSPLKVKEVHVQDRRYIVCYNEDQAGKDRADREAIIAHLEQALRQGDKSLVGNKGYRRYLTNPGPEHFEIDAKKVRTEARYDGKWVLRTDTELSAADVALKYKELWMVENVFRELKSIVRTRPIYHHHDETIRGHVFCSFLALVLLKELFDRLAAKGYSEVEWGPLKGSLDDLERFQLACSDKTFDIRTDLSGDAGKALRAVGVSPGPVIREAAP
jgi:transposase